MDRPELSAGPRARRRALLTAPETARAPLVGSTREARTRGRGIETSPSADRDLRRLQVVAPAVVADFDVVREALADLSLTHLRIRRTGESERAGAGAGDVPACRRVAMADDTAMLTIEPDEPVVHNVRLQQAYRTTVTLRNNTRNAMELTIRAGSPERWAVAPSTVFLEAGRTMRVDLRLKLTRELRPRRLAGGAAPRPARWTTTAPIASATSSTSRAPTSSGVSTHPSSWRPPTRSPPRPRATPKTEAGASLSPPPRPRDRAAHPPRSVAERSRSASPGMERPSTSRPHLESTRGRSAPLEPAPDRTPTVCRLRCPWTRRASTRRPSARWTNASETLERENRRKDLAARDKDELIRALYSRLELAKTNAPAPAPPSRRDPPEGAEEDAEEEGTVAGDALHAARAKQAELHGANAALRGRCRELDGELQASREEAAGLRRRLTALESDKVPELSNLVAQALAQERSAFEAQSLKALRVLEAKDSVLAARERETAEARARCGALNTTLTATRRELDACEARLITTLEEQGQLRDDAERARAASEETATRLTRERDALQRISTRRPRRCETAPRRSRARFERRRTSRFFARRRRRRPPRRRRRRRKRRGFARL